MTNIYIARPTGAVYERSSIDLEVNFRAAGASAVPATIHYRIDCLTTDIEIKSWTEITPAASVTLSITSNENRIISNSNRIEKRQVTVSSDKGTYGERRKTIEFNVHNIRGVE